MGRGDALFYYVLEDIWCFFSFLAGPCLWRVNIQHTNSFVSHFGTTAIIILVRMKIQYRKILQRKFQVLLDSILHYNLCNIILCYPKLTITMFLYAACQLRATERKDVIFSPWIGFLEKDIVYRCNHPSCRFVYQPHPAVTNSPL